jgi:hypothetical protein
MAQENVGINITVGGNQDQAIGSLKKQLREATQEVQALSDKFGATSEQAVKAAKKAAELKDRIGDAKDLVSAFNPDAKFKSLTGALQGVAGGFAAVQGAVGLFGKENEDLQKTLVKVQSAMALSQGLDSVMSSIDAFKNLGAVIKNQVAGAFNALKGAIGATGIGILVVSVGLLVANFDKVKQAVLNLVPGLKQLGTFFSNIITKVTDFVGVTSQAERALASLEKTTKRGNEGIEARIKVLTAQGGKEKEIYALSKQQGENELNFLRAKLKTKEGLNVEELKKFRDLKTEQAVLDASEQKRIDDARKEKQNSRAEESKKEKEARDKVAKDIEEQNERRKEAEVKFFFDRIKAIDALNEQRAKEKAEQDALDKELLDKSAKEFEDFNNKEYNDLQVQIAKTNKLKEDARNAELQADIALQNAKFEAVSAGLNLLSSLAGENEKIANAIFVIDKALAIAKIVVDTQREISAYAANPTWSLLPDGGALIKGKYILGAKIRAGVGIATIAATSIAKFKGGGSAGGVGGGASAPSISAGAPLAPPQPQTTTLSNQSINALGNQAVKAYVIESDVTSSQQRIAAIQQRARFG